MFRGMYSAASSLAAAALNHEFVSENLAHVNTPGFRRRGVAFEAFLDPSADPYQSVPNGVRSAFDFHQLDTGPLQHTGNALDVAVEGDAFFVVQGPTGDLYTRNGAFQLNGQGQLMTGSGMLVRGQGGPITIPPGTSTIHIASNGAIFADNNEVGRLQLASFVDPRQLRHAGTTLFSGPAPQTPPEGTARVEQGYREGSNVQAVREMVSMMLGLRHYEAAERTLRAMSDSLAQNTRPQS